MSRLSGQPSKKTPLFGCLIALFAAFSVIALFVIISIALMLNSPDPDRFPERAIFGLDKPTGERVSSAMPMLSFDGPSANVPSYNSEYLLPSEKQVPFDEALATYSPQLAERGWDLVSIDREYSLVTWQKGSRVLTISEGRGFDPARVREPIVLVRKIYIVDSDISIADRLKQVFKG